MIRFAPPRLQRMAWERRLVRGLAGHTFSETLLITEASASAPAEERESRREGRQPQPRPPPPPPSPEPTRAHLLLRLLSHDKPHVATMLASEVREDKASGVMIQETGTYYVIKVRHRVGELYKGSGLMACWDRWVGCVCPPPPPMRSGWVWKDSRGHESASS